MLLKHSLSSIGEIGKNDTFMPFLVSLRQYQFS